MIKALIVEDEQHCIDRLLAYISNHKNTIEILAICTSVEEAVIATKKHHPNLVFLDIQIHDQTGFDYLQQLKSINFEIIFTTAFDNFAVKAFKFSALDYLLKPIDADDFNNAISKLEQKIETSNIETQLQTLFHNLNVSNSKKQIAIPNLNGYDIIKIEDIIYCEARTSYTEIVTNQNKLVASKPLKFYENLLNDTHFFRIHNSHLVNINHVRKYTKGKGGYVTMSNRKIIDVSTRRKEDFLKLLTSY